MTLLAVEVAARGPYGEDGGSGKEMIERLFLDRIDIQGVGFIVCDANNRAVYVLSDKAVPYLALGE